jgi:hypothetical protein
MPNSNSCRLCSGISKFRFSKTVLGSVEVDYFQCSECQSLQTESPYWLSEAYSDPNERFDTGQFIRCLHNASFIDGITHYLGLEQDLILDYGCGSGLTARICRDVGLDAWGYDRHSTPRLLMGFLKDDLDGARIVNLCEVAEHFSDPRSSFDHVFSGRPDVVICATEIYQGEGSDWPYLSPEHGQHVFFYSWQAMNFLAQRYGKSLVNTMGYTIFFEPRLTSLLLDSVSSEINANLASVLQTATPQLLKKIMDFGYRYAMLDNHRLVQEERPSS